MFTGNLEGIGCRDEEEANGNNCAVSVIRGRLLANMVEMTATAARKFTDNLDEKKVLSSDCTNCFARFKCNIDEYVKAASSVGTRSLSGIGNQPMPVTKNRRKSRSKDCTESHAS